MADRARGRRQIVAVVVAACLSLAACGGSSGDDRSSQRLPNPSITSVPSSTGPDLNATTASSTSSTTDDDDAGSVRAGTGGTDDTGIADSEPAWPETGGCENLDPGVARLRIDAGGPTTPVRVYVPRGAGDQPLPVVLDWHGLGSNGTQQATLTGYESLARREGFLAVHPTGAPAAGTGANSWELAPFDDPERDDLAMVDALIDELVTGFCADPTRIYSTGLSNGGFFTARLICERADRIAAAVAVAGVSHPDDCRPVRPVPFAAFHGTADEVVTFDGGPSVLQAGRSSPELDAFFAQNMPDEFAEFAADFGCWPEPEAVTVSQGDRVAETVVRHDYQSCNDEVPLSFYEIVGGGHTWPGSPLGLVLTAALGPTTYEVDATAEGWAFMSRFRLPDPG